MGIKECKIRWKDDGDEWIVWIYTDDPILHPVDDDEIFFYCKDEEELEDLMREDNGQNFVVVEILN